MLGSEDCFRMSCGVRLAEVDTGPSCFCRRACVVEDVTCGSSGAWRDYVTHNSNDTSSYKQ